MPQSCDSSDHLSPDQDDGCFASNVRMRRIHLLIDVIADLLSYAELGSSFCLAESDNLQPALRQVNVFVCSDCVHHDEMTYRRNFAPP